ncbi:type II secretion system F family protein [Kocuria sp. CPCC 205268]|uniref:type II secretion system F family protein n=1 Tax=Kocuria oxytropis TaxID=3058913 RepID=UPI0034D5B067
MTGLAAPAAGLLLLAAVLLAVLPSRSRLPGPHRPAAARRPPAADVSAGVLVELTAAMLDAGLPLAEVVAVLGGSRTDDTGSTLQGVGSRLRLGLPWHTAWASAGELPPHLEDYREALAFTATSGAPSARSLRSQAAQVRRAAYRRAERAAESLSVQLVLPLGLCSLPAFVCWGVLPVVLGLVPEVFG